MFTRRGFFGLLFAAPVAAFAAMRKPSWVERWNAFGAKVPPRPFLTLHEQYQNEMLRQLRRSDEIEMSSFRDPHNHRLDGYAYVMAGAEIQAGAPIIVRDGLAFMDES